MEICFTTTSFFNCRVHTLVTQSSEHAILLLQEFGCQTSYKKKQKSEGAGVVGSLHLNPSFQFPFDLPLIGVDKTNVPVACGGVILASDYSYIILFVKNYIAAIFDFYCSGWLGREINLY